MRNIRDQSHARPPVTLFSARPAQAQARSSDAKAAAAERRRLDQDLRAAATKAGSFCIISPALVAPRGRMVAAEALIRWPHRRRGLVPPAAFIPLAEQCGLITPIGGLGAPRRLRRGGDLARAADVSVNVSARQIQDGALLGQFAAALDESGLAPERLELELTELMLVDAGEETLFVLSAIRDLGVGIALDDFGTGFASLAMLKRLPLTVMKLDRSLVREVPHDREDTAIVRAVAETGRALGLTVVAEGIETEAQRDSSPGSAVTRARAFCSAGRFPPPGFATASDRPLRHGNLLPSAAFPGHSPP